MAKIITGKNLSEEKEIRNATLEFIDFCADFTASICDQDKGCDTNPLSDKQTEFKKILKQQGPFTNPQINHLIDEAQGIVINLQRKIGRQTDPKISDDQRLNIYDERYDLELQLREIGKLVEREFDRLIIEDKTTGQRPTEQDEIKGDEIAFPKYAFNKIGKFHPGKTYYDLIFKNQPIRLRGLGADYIYYLMRDSKYPNEIDVVELWKELKGTPEKDPNNEEFIKTIDKQVINLRMSPDEEFVEMTDIKTIGQIRKNIKDLEEEKEEAKKNNDYGRIDAIKTKLDELYKYLSESTIQGRIKTFASQKNRIIDRVRKAMENTLSEIRKDNEEAYNHLSTAFKPLTSDPKSYKPTEDIPWKFN